MNAPVVMHLLPSHNAPIDWLQCTSRVEQAAHNAPDLVGMPHFGENVF